MVKIDIISGFLGAGKTTFANMLLKYYMRLGLKPVYIVNEFGQTGLDAEIIKADGFEAVEMEGGCICCTLKDDIAATIEKVIDAFSPTNIVFEPSGIFIFDNFFEILKQPKISGKCEIANVFTVVDSVNFSFSKAVFGSFIYNQIKNAEIILLSKLEKKQNADELICDIENINPDVFIMSKIWSQWNDGDFDSLLNKKKIKRIGHHAHHHSNLQSVTIKTHKRFTQSEIDNFIDLYQSGVFGNLCRIKGVLITENKNILINITLNDVVLKEFKGAEPMITFIGQEINEKEIRNFLLPIDK